MVRLAIAWLCLLNGGARETRVSPSWKADDVLMLKLQFFGYGFSAFFLAERKIALGDIRGGGTPPKHLFLLVHNKQYHLRMGFCVGQSQGVWATWRSYSSGQKAPGDGDSLPAGLVGERCEQPARHPGSRHQLSVPAWGGRIHVLGLSLWL